MSRGFYNLKAIKINPLAARAAVKVQSSRTVQRPKLPWLGNHQVAKLPHGSSQVVLLPHVRYPLASAFLKCIDCRPSCCQGERDYSSKASALPQWKEELDKRAAAAAAREQRTQPDRKSTELGWGVKWRFDCRLQRWNDENLQWVLLLRTSTSK